MKTNWEGRLTGLVTGVLFVLVNSCTHDPFIDPDSLNNGQPNIPGCTNTGEICFESNVLPIFVSYCARAGCHDAVTREEGFVLDSYANIVRKGIKPGDANDSKLYEVLFESGDDRMPPDAPLTQAQKDSIKVWINQGAKNTVNCACYCDETKFTFAADIEPIINNACEGCHKPGFLGGNINLDGYSNIKAQADNGNLMGVITHASGFVPMPQGGKLSECEIKKIQSWINSGAPNN
jgi:hypothetical protein